MAIASVGTLGTGVSSTSNSSFTLSTATNTLADGDFGILTIVTDNIATADGDTNTHTSVSGGTGTWSKLGEYTNTVGGAGGDGVCTSVWLFQATGTLSTSTTITMDLSGNATDKASSFWKFTKAAGTSIAVDAGPTTNGVDGTNGFGSVSFSSLPSKSRLYFRGLGKEANSTTDITVSTNFTAISVARSRNSSSAVFVRGEFRINTSTGETSNPTLAVSGDTAGVFVALSEAIVDAPSTGSLSLTGYAPAAVLALTAAMGAGSISTQGTGWVAPKIETAVNTGSRSGGLLLALGTMLEGASGVTVNPSTGSITVAGQTPVRIDGVVRTPSAGAVSLTGETPTRLESAVRAPSAGSVSVTGQTPVRLDGAVRVPSAGALSLSGQTPTRLENLSRVPSAGSVSLAGQAPTGIENSLRLPSVGSLALTGYEPSVLGTGSISPSTGSVSITGYAPSLGGTTTVAPAAGAYSFTGYAPTVNRGAGITPSTGSLSLTGYAPNALVPRTVTPSAGGLSLTAYAPTVNVGATGGGGYGGLLAALGINLEPMAVRAPTSGALGLTGYAPTLSRTSGSSGSGLLVALGSLTQAAGLSGIYRPSTASLRLTGYAPSIERTITDVGSDEFVAGPATFSGTGTKNAIYDPKIATPAVGSLSFTGNAPLARLNLSRTPLTGALVVTRYQPTVQRNFVVNPVTGSLTIIGSKDLGYGGLAYGVGTYGTPRAPLVSVTTGPKSATVRLLGHAPTVLQAHLATPSVGSLTATGYAPSLKAVVLPLTGAISFTGYAPSAEYASSTRTPVSGVLTFTGYGPTIVRGYFGSGTVNGGRAYLEIYQDTSVAATFSAGIATTEFSTGQITYGEGSFVAGAATTSIRNWIEQAEAINGWSLETDASDIWTEITPNTDTWNG